MQQEIEQTAALRALDDEDELREGLRRALGDPEEKSAWYRSWPADNGEHLRAMTVQVNSDSICETMWCGLLQRQGGGQGAKRATPAGVTGSMKAILLDHYGPPADLELRDIPEPEPAEREVLVKVHATAVRPPVLSSWTRVGRQKTRCRTPAAARLPRTLETGMAGPSPHGAEGL